MTVSERGEPGRPPAGPAANLAELLAQRKIVVCVGSGGVGKTTTAAALALHAAKAGRRTIVCTIDPARRLANALGLPQLDHTERRVPDEKLGGRPAPGGSLHAMMLDQKRAFDEVVARYARDPAVLERILSNRIYQQVSSSLTGSLEYAAMAKLQALDRDDRFDLIVLDTPPTANALDFLDAPRKLTDAIDSPAIQWFIKPYMKAGRFSLKLIGRGGAFVLRRLGRFVGSQFLEDIAQFLVEFNQVLGGFRERAQEVFDLLRAPRVTFLLVCSPDPLAVDEAIFFFERLAGSQMPTGAFIVNRVHLAGGACPAPEDVVARLAGRPELSALSPEEVARAARGLRENYQQFETLAAVDGAQIARLRARCGSAQPYVQVPFFDRDIYDTAGLGAIERHLFPSAVAPAVTAAGPSSASRT
ncbi:MAG TPA: ArsA-related P-loop ATPase [Polyangia bacterium]|nr:ArsA-related P-loop ATPase [Polyangia bacterium]